jgi:hypothetical protein
MKGHMGEHEWTVDPGRDAAVVSVDQISSIQGRRGKPTLIIVDEAQGVDADLWDALESLMTSEASRMVASGNPLWPEGRFYEFSRSPEWHHIEISCLDHPNVKLGLEKFVGAVTKLSVEEKRRAWGEEDHRYIARVLGRYPEGAGHRLVTLRDLTASASVDTSTLPKDGLHVGIDVAGDGGDLNVASIVKDRVLVDQESWGGIDTMATTGRIVRLMARVGAKPGNVHIDKCGLGVGIVNRLWELGHYVDGVDFGAGAVGDWADSMPHDRFANRRVELYCATATAIRHGQLSVPERFKETREDLMAVDFIPPASDGGLKLEKKEQVKKRIGRSPDHGDSLCLSMSRMGQRSYLACG